MGYRDTETLDKVGQFNLDKLEIISYRQDKEESGPKVMDIRGITLNFEIAEDIMSNNLVGSVIVFDGRLDQPTVQEDFTNGSATVQVKASSHWSDFQSTNGRHTNDSEQQALHTGDTFFEKAAEVNKDVKWGRE